MSAIRSLGLRRAFGELIAVAGLDLDVADGEIFGLVGPDGAGKTTTMRMLTGILPPTAGTARCRDAMSSARRTASRTTSAT